MEQRTENAMAGIISGGVLCGLLDIGYAFLLYGWLGVLPGRLLQGIASGIMGRSAFVGGMATAALGLFLHFVIAFGAATVYYAVSRKLRFMITSAVWSGFLYGVAVHVFMNFVVIPLSAVAHRPINWGIFILNAFEHMLLVGLPIALSIRHFSAPIQPEILTRELQQAARRAV